MSARFITFEGGEGSGKSTQIALLSARLKQASIDHLLTREPGGAPAADLIRALLVTGDTGRWDGVSEALLHFAARREHLLHAVWPALAAGRWVVCDRFADSTMAYQGHGHGLGRAPIEQLYRIAVGDFRPDLTLILDIDPAVGLRRAAGRHGDEDRYERMDMAFHVRLREGFRAIAQAEPARCRLIDANRPREAVAADIWRAVAGAFSLPA
ncbi:MAG: dTMP kinase [Alphaproteobacteria bacterium]|nr:dTMP kinase [Alphaproteobacteria bacterium]